jgi:putative PIN family toxin of toxin-antitoxin system
VRVVLDTNVLLAALLTHATPPGQLYTAWHGKQFVLCSSERQLEEINRVTRRPYFRSRLAQALVGRMINDIRGLALMCDPLPEVAVSLDPDDDFLLAIAQAAGAEFLVSGDKSGLLSLKKHGSTTILTARELLKLLE